MKLRKTKLLAIILVVVLAASLFVACRNDPPPTQPQQPPAVAPPTVTPGDPPEEGAFEGRHLTAMFMSGGHADSAREIIVPLFEEMTGATVEIIDFPYLQMSERMLLDFTSGGGATFDVLQIPAQWDGKVAPFLLELDPFIARDNFDIEDFNQNVLDNSGRWLGVIRSIPHVNTAYQMLYRTDLVDTPPTTWAEYIEIAAYHHDPENGMFGIAPAAARGQYGSILFSRLWSLGGEWGDADWNPTWDSPEARRALEYTYQIIQLSDPASLNWGLPEAGAAFAAGNAVFLEAWPGLAFIIPHVGQDSNQIGDNWAAAPFPTEATGLTNLSAWSLGINAQTDEEDLAWAFIQFYTSLESALKIFEVHPAFMSARTSFWESPEVYNSPFYGMRQSLEDAVIWWRIPASEEIRMDVAGGWHSFVSGQMSIEDAMEYMNNTVTRVLADMPPPEGLRNELYDIVQARRG